MEKIFEKRGLDYESKVPRLLADGGAKTLMGRIGGMARALVMKPLRKAFKGVFFWLAIRQAVLTMLETYFLARFAQFPELDSGRKITQAEAHQWGQSLVEVASKLDKRLAKEGIRKIWQLMRQKKEAKGLSPEEVAQQLEEQAPGLLADFDLRMRQALEAV